MARFLTISALLLPLGLAHQLGDDENDAAALSENTVENYERPSSAPPRLEHLTTAKDGKDLMEAFWQKSLKKPKIVFADSGVGGLSIMSKFINIYKKDPLFRHAHLIFFDTAGLNDDAHSNVVKDLLAEIQDIEPDMLFIACNGLSKVYLESDDAKDPQYPVIQMLPFAVDYWGSKLKSKPGSTMVQFVSDFTGNTYKVLMHKDSSIIKGGIDKDRLIVQTCQEAITAIQEDGPDSEATQKEIDKCAKDALKKVADTDFKNKAPLFLGMGCTHFGWADTHFESAMKKGDAQDIEALDPNKKMAEWLFDNKPNDLEVGDAADDDHLELSVILRRHYKVDKIKELVAEQLKTAIEKAKVLDKDSSPSS